MNEVSGIEAKRPECHRRQTERKRNVEKREMGRTLENMGAGSRQNIPYWKIEVWGLGTTGRKYSGGMGGGEWCQRSKELKF